MPDAPNATSFLKGKVGGIPIWAIGGAAAVGAVGFIWYQNRKKPAASATDPNALGTAAGTAAAAPPIYVSTLPQTPNDGTSTPATPAAGWVTRGDIPGGYQGPIPVMAGPDGSTGQVGTLPENSPVTLASPTAVGGTWPGLGSRQFYKVSLPSGVSGYVLAQDLVAQGRGGWDGVSGMGGLHDTPWARMTQKYNVPAYWASGVAASGMGGAGAGAATHHVSHLAKKLGVSPHRLVSLNPQLRGQRFMTRPGQAILAG